MNSIDYWESVVTVLIMRVQYEELVHNQEQASKGRSFSRPPFFIRRII